MADPGFEATSVWLQSLGLSNCQAAVSLAFCACASRTFLLVALLFPCSLTYLSLVVLRRYNLVWCCAKAHCGFTQPTKEWLCSISCRAGKQNTGKWCRPTNTTAVQSIKPELQTGKSGCPTEPLAENEHKWIKLVTTNLSECNTELPKDSGITNDHNLRQQEAEKTRAPRPLHPKTPEGPQESWAPVSARPQRLHPQVKDKKYQHVPCPLQPPQRAGSKGAHCRKPWSWE